MPYHFRDTWVLTLGGIKKITPEWVLRVAGTYNQSPGNGFYRITSGDDYVIGASLGYQFYKNLAIDTSYAHAFTQNRPIDITSQRKRIVGINKGYRDSVSFDFQDLIKVFTIFLNLEITSEAIIPLSPISAADKSPAMA